MQFKDGADVLTADYKKVGSIDRVVIDPQSNEVTHVVVRRGFLLPEDKVVPIELFKLTTEDQAILREDAQDLTALPPFEEAHYVSWEEAAGETPSEYARSSFWYPPEGVAWWGYPAYTGYFGYAPYATPVKIERNIPEGAIPLQEGAKVITADGEDAGSVERVFTDSETDRITHLVISEGLIFKEKKLIPTAWVKSIAEATVQLSVNADVLERLPEYQET